MRVGAALAPLLGSPCAAGVLATFFSVVGAVSRDVRSTRGPKARSADALFAGARIVAPPRPLFPVSIELHEAGRLTSALLYPQEATSPFASLRAVALRGIGHPDGLTRAVVGPTLAATVVTTAVALGRRTGNVTCGLVGGVRIAGPDNPYARRGVGVVCTSTARRSVRAAASSIVTPEVGGDPAGAVPSRPIEIASHARGVRIAVGRAPAAAAGAVVQRAALDQLPIIAAAIGSARAVT